MSDFKNFAIMIPKYAIYNINYCLVFNATGSEFDEFKKWVESGKIIQLKVNDAFIDYWVNKDYSDFGIKFKTLTEWFNEWKNPPEKGYSFKSYKIQK